MLPAGRTRRRSRRRRVCGARRPLHRATASLSALAGSPQAVGEPGELLDQFRGLLLRDVVPGAGNRDPVDVGADVAKVLGQRGGGTELAADGEYRYLDRRLPEFLVAFG